MSALTREQVRHKVINLSKTLQLLERSVDGKNWTRQVAEEATSRWLEAQSDLAGINLCRNILSSMSPEDFDYVIGAQRSLSGQQFHDQTNKLLNRLEVILKDACQELKPQPLRQKLILPFVPRPSLPNGFSPGAIETRREDMQETAPNSHADSSSAPGGRLLPVDDSGNREQLRMAPNDSQALNPSQSEHSTNVSADKMSTLLPSTPRTQPSSSFEPTKTLEFLQSSSALHEELTDQLARMARQLRRNAEHFSGSLENDQDAIQSLEEKLERNYDSMTKERVRLRDHSSKSRETTWLTLLSIFVVIIGFMLSFFVIRIT